MAGDVAHAVAEADAPRRAPRGERALARQPHGAYAVLGRERDQRAQHPRMLVEMLVGVDVIEREAGLAEEFELRRIALPAHSRYAGEATYGHKALLVLHGSATVSSAGQKTSLGRGSIILVPSGTEFVLEAKADDMVVFQAGLPLHARGAA